MQNAVVDTPNGAICCKLWPKTISGRSPAKAEGNVSADTTSVVSADKTSVVSADKTSVVSADKTSVVSADISQDIPHTFCTEGRPRSGRPSVHNAWGMSWEMSADTMTQQMSCLLTPQMSYLRTQQMFCLHTNFLRISIQPRMVFGHSLQHVAPVGIPTTGACMVFRYAALNCSTLDPRFGGRWGPSWPGELFGAKKGTRET